MAIKNHIRAARLPGEPSKCRKKHENLPVESGLPELPERTILPRALPLGIVPHRGLTNKERPSQLGSRGDSSARALKTDLAARNSYGPVYGAARRLCCVRPQTERET
jgi:hypothetical protein